jgi:hypothetical protein
MMRLLRNSLLACVCTALAMVGHEPAAVAKPLVKIKVHLKLKVHVNDIQSASGPDGLNFQGVNQIPGFGNVNISGNLSYGTPDAKGNTPTKGTIVLQTGDGSTLTVKYSVNEKKNSESIHAILIFDGGTGQFEGWNGHGKLFLLIQENSNGGFDLLFTLDGVLKINPPPPS